MNRFRSILCPVDFSAHSRAALRYARAVAAAGPPSAKVTALFVNDPFLMTAAAAVYHAPAAFLARTAEELRRFVKAPRSPRGRGTPEITSIIGTGQPAPTILSTASKVGADLIVIGSAGLGGFDKLFFGSTTEQVLRHTTVPVLAVPPATGPRSRRTDSRGKLVIAPLDLGRQARRDAKRAAKAARELGAKLMLVHVVPGPQVPPWMTVRPAAAIRDRVVKARAALEHLRTGAARGAQCLVAVGDPGAEIAAIAAQYRDAVVVMTLRRMPGIVGRRAGAIAYRVLRAAAAPVLALTASD